MKKIRFDNFVSEINNLEGVIFINVIENLVINRKVMN